MDEKDEEWGDIRRVFDLAKSLNLTNQPINLSMRLASRVDLIDASGTLTCLSQVVKDATIAAIQNGRNSYTPTQGLADLGAQFRQQEIAFTQRDLAEDQLLVTSGVSGGLFLALLALVEPGDEVLIPDPYFVMYKHLVRLFGGVPVYLIPMILTSPLRQNSLSNLAPSARNYY